MRVHCRTTLLLLVAAATMLINTSCAHRGVLVPDTDYGRENDDPADTYRITTNNGAMFVATEIATTDTTVTILALEHKGDADLLFGATRYEDVVLPLTIDRADIRALERMERSGRATVGLVVLVAAGMLVIIGIFGGLQFVPNS